MGLLQLIAVKYSDNIWNYFWKSYISEARNEGGNIVIRAEGGRFLVQPDGSYGSGKKGNRSPHPESRRLALPARAQRKCPWGAISLTHIGLLYYIVRQPAGVYALQGAHIWGACERLHAEEIC